MSARALCRLPSVPARSRWAVAGLRMARSRNLAARGATGEGVHLRRRSAERAAMAGERRAQGDGLGGRESVRVCVEFLRRGDHDVRNGRRTRTRSLDATVEGGVCGERPGESGVEAGVGGANGKNTAFKFCVVAY